MVRRRLRPLHPPSRRHHAADGGDAARRPRRLSAAAGRAAAAGRLSDHHRHRHAARRLARDHGLLGRAAAGAAVRADPRRLADDLDELARRDARSPSSSTSTATSTPPPTTSRRRSTPPAGQLPKNLPSPPTYRKVNPADSPILILSRHLGRRADHRGRRRRREHPRPADQPDLRRVAGPHRRPAEAGDPHPDRPGQAGREGPAAGGRARADRHRHRRQPEGLDHRRQAGVHHLRQRPVDRRPSDWNDVIVAYRNGAPVRVRDIGQAVAGPADTTQAAWAQRQARRLPRRVQAARRQRHQHRRQHQADAAAAAGGDPADDPGQRALATAPRPSAPRSRTCSSR